jgi:hypothetical protein
VLAGGRGKGSGIPVENRFFTVWTFERDKVIPYQALWAGAKPSKPPGCGSRRRNFFGAVPGSLCHSAAQNVVLPGAMRKSRSAARLGLRFAPSHA